MSTSASGVGARWPAVLPVLPIVSLLLGGPVLLQPHPAQAQAQATDPPADWPKVKCERYAAAWRDVLGRLNSAGGGQESGLRPEFLARQEAFIASGCTSRHDVCPRTARELEVANTLSLRAINAGMTGSFLPFACPD